MADLRFKPIDHPSDVGIIAYGKTPQEIFENAALGMFSLMADLDKVEPKQTLRLRVEGEDLESLLVNWLNELIFNEDAKKMLFKDFKIIKLTNTELEAEVAGEKINLGLHDIYRPIKAATYNQLEIHSNWAKVIFDV
jgi:SHS2 domain-containing protein